MEGRGEHVMTAWWPSGDSAELFYRLTRVSPSLTSLVTHQRELEQEATGMDWAAAGSHHASTRHHASAQARPTEQCRGGVWAAQCRSAPRVDYFKKFLFYIGI